MIELTIGMMVVVLLVSGLVQLIPLYMTHSEMLAETRGNAGEKALNPIALSDSPEYITDWNEGVDGERHTADDEAETGDTAALLGKIINKTSNSDEGWALLDSSLNSSIPDFRNNLTPTEHFDLVSQENEEVIPIDDDLIRDWAYRKDEITLRVEAWIPKLGGIY